MKAFDFLKVVVPSLQCWGSAVMNIPGDAIAMCLLANDHQLHDLSLANGDT